MGQVPRAKPWLLLGDGRLATHLDFYLQQLGIACCRWSRRRGWHQPPPGGAGHSLDGGLPHFGRVLAAIADDALPGFIERHQRPGDATDRPTWIHFSGSLTTNDAWSAHPLCAFGPELYDKDFYPRILFVVEAEGPTLAQLLPGLPNPSSELPAVDRPLYHALCVSAGNFTTLLWQRFFVEIEQRWGLSAEVALPYLEKTIANLAGPVARQALTGPIARGDSATIGRNLDALDSAGLGSTAGIYRAFLVAPELAAQRPVAQRPSAEEAAA